jgi:hypothetical protein
MTARFLRYRTGTVSVEPFFAKIIASSRAGCVWLALFETSCVAPGCSHGKAGHKAAGV